MDSNLLRDALKNRQAKTITVEIEVTPEILAQLEGDEGMEEMPMEGEEQEMPFKKPATPPMAPESDEEQSMSGMKSDLGMKAMMKKKALNR